MRIPMLRSTLFMAGTLAIALAVAPAALAGDDKRMEETTTTTTTTTQGTVSQVGPNSIVVTEPGGAMTYQTKTTTYVDENGNPVAIETVKSGTPVVVYHDKSGDKATATKVVVRKRTVEREVEREDD